MNQAQAEILIKLMGNGRMHKNTVAALKEYFTCPETPTQLSLCLKHGVNPTSLNKQITRANKIIKLAYSLIVAEPVKETTSKLTTQEKAAQVIDLFLGSKTITSVDIRETLGWSSSTCRKWIIELEAKGAIRHKGFTVSKYGSRCPQYTLIITPEEAKAIKYSPFKEK